MTQNSEITPEHLKMLHKLIDAGYKVERTEKLTRYAKLDGNHWSDYKSVPDESGEYQYCYLVTAPDGQQHGTFGEFAFWEMFLKNKIKKLDQQSDKSATSIAKSDLKSDKSTTKPTKKRKNQVDELLTRFER